MKYKVPLIFPLNAKIKIVDIQFYEIRVQRLTQGRNDSA